MPSSPDDRELNQILARGQLSGAEYDAIERNVLGQLEAKPRRTPWRALAPAMAIAAGVCVWVLAKGPGEQHSVRRETETQLGFSEKGEGEGVLGSALGVVSAGCGGASRLACRLGDTLMFSVTANPTPVYLAAYAERSEEARGSSRIWYFPKKAGEAPRLAAQSGTAVFQEGVRLGPPHAPGRYRIVVWLSESPVRREVTEGLPEHAEQSFTLQITE
jgi:hypothetical protein